MLFNSFEFLIYFPLVVIIYFVTPAKIRWIWLLVCSMYFYMCWKAKYIILIGFSIFVTWLGSIIMDKAGDIYDDEKAQKISKITLYIVLFLNLTILFVFKYYNFFAENITSVTGISLPFLRFALPVGISFYTFQALGYSIDVYRGTIKAEKICSDMPCLSAFFHSLLQGLLNVQTTFCRSCKNRHILI